jgi:hypothetical protein
VLSRGHPSIANAKILRKNAGITLGLVSRVAHRQRGEAEMTKYLAGVLSVIAVGVLLIAYGLLNPRTVVDASGATSLMRPTAVSETVSQREAVPAYPANRSYGYVPAGYMPTAYGAQPAQALTYVPAPAAYAQPVAMVQQAPAPVRTVAYEPAAPRRASTTRYVERKPRRDWKRTAMIVGGSSAAGAGVGAIFGGKKGALIGAAIGGGASTIYETVK